MFTKGNSLLPLLFFSLLRLSENVASIPERDEANEMWQLDSQWVKGDIS